jgi:hypothetical protein
MGRLYRVEVRSMRSTVQYRSCVRCPLKETCKGKIGVECPLEDGIKSKDAFELLYELRLLRKVLKDRSSRPKKYY